MKVKVKKLNPKAVMPTKGSEGAACWDVSSIGLATVEYPRVVPVGTGLAFEVPEGFFIDIRPRSGLSLALRICNSPGTLDSDYRGELIILLQSIKPNISHFIKEGDRIAQIRLVKLEDYTFKEVEDLRPSRRGSRGFGSTGK